MDIDGFGMWKNSRMITLQCGEEQVLLWVNPEEIQVETGALHKIVETACGEVIQTGGPTLARVTLETMLPASDSPWRRQGTSPADELRQLHAWQKNGSAVGIRLDPLDLREYYLLSMEEILREGDPDIGIVLELTEVRKPAATDLTPDAGGVPQEDPDQEFPTRYTVVKGDNLSKIAKRFYGKTSYWKNIYEANLDQIKNPNLIYPGQQLVIPALA